MPRNLLHWVRISIPLLFVIIAYKILIQGEFPWVFLFLLLVVSLIGLSSFSFTPFRRTTATEQSAFVKFQVELLKGMAVGLLLIMLYDYFVRHTLRWETYTGLLTAQLMLLLIGLLLSLPRPKQ